VAAVTFTAFALHPLPYLSRVSPLMLAIVVGIAIRNTVGVPAVAEPGVASSMRVPLRIGIVLLGLQLTVAQVLDIGLTGLLILVAAVLFTYLFTVAVGRALGVEPKLAQLLAAGTSICGASAIVAANTVVHDRDGGVAYALAVVTLCGTAAMVLYPLVPAVISMTSHAYGLWIGASVHEVAQVVAAAFVKGDVTGQYGTVAKLTRVLTLAPMVLLIRSWQPRMEPADDDGKAAAPVPWFIVGFVLMVALASAHVFPAAWTADFMFATQVLLCFALASVGLETCVFRIAAKGFRPLLLGILSSLFIALLTLALVQLTDK
jgi:uncharacterized integral membrane protein (TIGR00698 family)